MNATNPEKWAEIWIRYDLTGRTIEHLSMVSISLVLATGIGLMLAMLIYQKDRTGTFTLHLLNIIETIPDIALLVLLVPVAGIGKIPTIIACILYALLPVTRNAWTGLRTVNADLIETGNTLGLTRTRILLHIRLPLALPFIMGGVRIALVFIMGIVTLGGIIGAGGLGAPLQTGIFSYNRDLIILVGLWVGFLAILLDGIAVLLEKKISGRYGS